MVNPKILLRTLHKDQCIGLIMLLGSLVIMECYSFVSDGPELKYFAYSDVKITTQTLIHYSSGHISKMMMYAAFLRISGYKFHNLLNFLFIQETVALIQFWGWYSNDTFDSIRLVICGIYITYTLWQTLSTKS